MRKQEIETVNIAILAHKMEDILFEQIIEIAKTVKSLKIITDNITNLSYLENKLYTDYGIAIQITNNKEKALLNAQIILNFDFDEEKINTYNLYPYATIVSLKEEIEINKNDFKGVVIDYYKIEYNKEIIEKFKHAKDYDSNTIFESLIYRKDTYSNIRKILTSYNAKLIALLQKNKEITNKEIA